MVGGSTLKEKTHLRRSHGIIGICLRKHLGLRLLPLWQSNKANRSPHCVPQGSTLTMEPHHPDPNLLSPQRRGAIVTVGYALEHTTGADGIVVVAETRDIIKDKIQRKNIHYINFPRVEDRNISRKSIVYNPGQRAQQHLIHNRYGDI